ncbi:MAG TPA: LapA family protein [Sphingomicrobium sp.]|jgi:predicted histidine transporter YuiF (NhaC family)|nr:LapA family protein [Sphingomicrobium sp.]
MSITSDPNLWVICGLVFLLGLLIGVFLTAGGRRKWKARYKSEADRREALERDHEAREKEWRERDSLRGAAVKDRDRDERPM